MIPLPQAFEIVEARLKAGVITGSEASQAIFRARHKLGPPWHWKSWKAARQQVLGAACETCGAGEYAILYVQHTVRVPRVRPYLEKAKRDLEGKEFEPVDHAKLHERMYAIRDAEEPEMRDCCPQCSSLSIQYRKKAATWICNSTSTGTYCAHVFDVPAKKAALTADQKRSIRRKKYQAWRDTVLNREDDWRRDAMFAWIAEMRVYLSLQHTKTLCKRCAFLEDMTEHKPCRYCGFAYPKTERVCPDCEQVDGDLS